MKRAARVKVFRHPDGSVAILPKIPVTALRGMLKRRRRAVSIEEMNEAIAEAAASADLRSRR